MSDVLVLESGRTCRVSDGLAWLAEHGRTSPTGERVVGAATPSGPTDELSLSLAELLDETAKGDVPTLAQLARDLDGGDIRG